MSVRSHQFAAVWRAATIALLWLAASMLEPPSAHAQRMQFPTPLAGQNDVAPTSTTANFADPNSAPTTFVPSMNAAPSAPTTFVPSSPIPQSAVSTADAQTTPWDPYSAPSIQPSLNAGATAAPYSPYSASPYAPPPSSPYSTTPSALFPASGPGPVQAAPPGTLFPGMGQPIRFLQELRLRQTWLARGNNDNNEGFGITSTEISSTFQVPVLFTQPPVLITPGFGVHFLNGPKTGPPSFADMPPEVYDAYLDVAWQPKINNFLSLNLGARAGIYSDFNAVDTQSIRIMGRALGVINLRSDLQLAVGIVYIDRIPLKLLPAGGVIYTPNPDTRYEIIFPNPKISHRWTTLGTTDLWIYVAGEYGGGAWTIHRASGADDDVGYNDIRISLGIETYGASRARGMFEIGYVFDRQLVYRSGTPQFDPSDTVMLRAGLNY
jgi:hypothetical protein